MDEKKKRENKRVTEGRAPAGPVRARPTGKAAPRPEPTAAPMGMPGASGMGAQGFVQGAAPMPGFGMTPGMGAPGMMPAQGPAVPGRPMAGTIPGESRLAGETGTLPHEETRIVGTGTYDPANTEALATPGVKGLYEDYRGLDGMPQGVDAERLQEFSRVLNRYKAGKASIDRRVQSAERWWKIRNSFEEAKMTDGPMPGFQAQSSWLHNVINSKHADALEAYPTPNILAREDGDKLDAWALSKIVPVIMEQNEFEQTYDEAIWQKLKTGTAVYQVSWDKDKLGGLGDIAIGRVDLLNLFWEPGITDIQKSKYLFHTEWVDTDEIKDAYPEIEDKVLSSSVIPTKMPTDDYVPTDGKVVVVDVYYHKHGKLHYCKYIGSTVLYATENDPERADRGLYDHGMYPFVFDVMFPVEGAPCGYGYVDICSNTQLRIDKLNTAFMTNAMVGATPRFFFRADGAVNEEEFRDLSKNLIHVNGNLGEDSLRAIVANSLPGNYINLLTNTVQELRETTGNTETSTGSSSHGVTAASALAALQEASGKTSRASTITTYRAYRKIVNLVIELIRQFYELPREFRITGNMGMQKYISFSNAGMQPQAQGVLGGVDLGYRVPVYDVYVEAEKRTSYTRMAQNELALQLYSAGVFNPQLADQTSMLLDMMDFDGKDELLQKVAANGSLYQQMLQYKAMAATLAAKYEPGMVQGLLGGGQQPQPKEAKQGEGTQEIQGRQAEPGHVQKARERAAAVTQPGG